MIKFRQRFWMRTLPILFWLREIGVWRPYSWAMVRMIKAQEADEDYSRLCRGGNGWR